MGLADKIIAILDGEKKVAKTRQDGMALLYVQLLLVKERVDQTLDSLESYLVKRKSRTYLPDIKKKVMIRRKHFLSVTPMSSKDYRFAALEAKTSSETNGVKSKTKKK